LSLALTAAAPAAANPSFPTALPVAGGEPVPSTGGGMAGLLQDHGGLVGHLPQRQQNVELVSRLELVIPGVGPAAPEQIADVAVHKNAAYLNSWSQPVNPATQTCERGGVFSVDISDPAQPKQLAFRPALPGNYHGEGAHVITFPDGRDILAVNNELCTPSDEPPPAGGGFALYDVSTPANPVKLVDAAGDYGPVGKLVCCGPNAEGAEDDLAHDYHSVFMWQDDGRVYLIGVDNVEQAQTDVDIFDITNPSAPVAVREYDFDEEFPSILDGAPEGLGGNVLLHDMVVKEINGIQTLLASYWDGGYVLANVEDPAAATYIGDTRFDDVDPLTDVSPPEGNAHQAEFSHDNRFILAADEDFDARRVRGRVNPGTPGAFQFNGAGQTADGGPLLGPDRILEGDSRYVGTGCTPANIPAATQTVTIAIVNAFNCPFRAKTDNVEAKGYRGLIIFAPSSQELEEFSCDRLLNLGGYADYEGDVVTLWVSREAGFRMMGRGQGFACGTANDTPTPNTVIEGEPVEIASVFDGWGYAHLYRNGSGKLDEVGKPYAIPEALDERFATDFGDLSIHEFATDPQVNLAYSAYYSGGLRVVSFGDDGLREVGSYIDARGSNFWGVEQFTSNCQRLIAASDRDFGLYIFRYTGPGAAQPCTTPAAPTPPTPPAAKDVTEPRISLLSNRGQSLRALRTTGLKFRIRVNEAARVEVALRGRFTSSLKRGARGKARMLKDNGAINVAANQIVTVTLRPSAALRRKLRGEKRLPGLLSVRAVDAAGNDATRTKALTFR
jgi:hypothetical protein